MLEGQIRIGMAHDLNDKDEDKAISVTVAIKRIVKKINEESHADGAASELGRYAPKILII
jgi:hypothetical protein